MESENRISSNSSDMLAILYPQDVAHVDNKNQSPLYIEDIWQNIFPFLELKDILSLRETSKLTRKFTAKFSA